MTTGSGNGWPDVIKVPAQATEHDPLCQRDEPDHWCECELIRKVVAREQERHGNNCQGLWDEWTHDLRAEIQALPSLRPTAIGSEYLLRADVLALIDGGSG